MFGDDYYEFETRVATKFIKQLEEEMATKKTEPTPIPARQPRFWIVLAEDHQVKFGDRAYSFARFDSLEAAEHAAERMTRQYAKTFYVMQEVATFRISQPVVKE